MCRETTFEAARWYLLAAQQGSADAQYELMLGIMYHHGEVVPQDLVKAYMWLILSAAQGDQLAEKNRDMLTRQMTPAQLAEAQNQAAEWRPKKASNTALAETMPLSPSPETSEPDAAR